MFQSLGFLASPTGMTLIGVLAALIVAVWDWRFALVALVVIQFAVAEISVVVHDMPAEWATIQVAVMVLSAMILGLSAVRTGRISSYQQSGNWLLRVAALVFVYVGWRYVEVDLALPEIHPEVLELFTWLVLCGVIILGLGENPLFVAVALLLWIVPLYSVVAILLSIPSLVAVIGILQLLLALACSYLLLAEQLGRVEEPPVITDIMFPEQTNLSSAGERREASESGVTVGRQALEDLPSVPMSSAADRQWALGSEAVAEGEAAELLQPTGESGER